MKDFVVKYSEKDYGSLSEPPSSPIEEEASSALTYTEYFQNSSEDERNLVLNLCELFNEIDFTGEKYITWDDFMSYLLDAVSDQSSKEDQIKEYGLSFTSPGSDIDDAIKKICYFDNWDKIVTCGKTKRCRIYEAKDMSVVASLPDHDGAILDAEYLPNPYNLLVTSSADLSVRFWNTSRLEFDLEYLEQQDVTQTAIKFYPRNNILFTASRTGDLTYWVHGIPPNDYRKKAHLDKITTIGVTPKYQKQQNKDSSREVFYQSRRIPNLHQDVITDMIALPMDNRVVTSSLDSTIKIFDVEKEVKVKEFLGHNKGVVSIAWTNEYHFLISAGSEREPLVWIANVENRSPFRLRDQRSPHQHSLIGVYAVPNTPQIISADHRGLIKIWDIRTHRCCQTIYTEQNLPKTDFHNFYLNSFAYMNQRKQIVTASRTIKLYEYERTEKPKGADDYPLILALYNPSNLHFMSCSRKGVKLWDALSGACSKNFRNISTTDITAACIDDRGRKFIVGNHSGEIICYNFSNASLVKQMSIFQSEITSLTYCDDGSKCIVVGSADGNVAIVLDKTNYEVKELKFAHKTEVKCSSFSRTYAITVTGDASSYCFLWDMKNYSKLAEIKGQGGEITALCFMGVLPAFIAAENTGRLIMYTTRPFHTPNIPIVQWFNESKTETRQDSSQSDNRSFITETPATTSTPFSNLFYPSIVLNDDTSSLKSGNTIPVEPNRNQLYHIVTALEYDFTCNRLITGDEKGFICVYDMENIVEEAQIRLSSRMSLGPKIPLSEISKLRPEKIARFKAHTDAISKIQIIREPYSILTSSLDSCSAIWTFNGELMDSLRQETKEWNDVEFEKIMNDPTIVNPKPFNFPINLEERRKEDALTVSGVIEKITKQLRLIGIWKSTTRESNSSKKDVISILNTFEKSSSSAMFMRRGSRSSPLTSPSVTSFQFDTKKVEDQTPPPEGVFNRISRSQSPIRTPSPSLLSTMPNGSFLKRKFSTNSLSTKSDSDSTHNTVLVERRATTTVTKSRKKPMLALVTPVKK